MTWSHTPPSTEGYSYWRDLTSPLRATPVLVKAVWLAPTSGPRVLAAAPWSGGLTAVAEMGGLWLALDAELAALRHQVKRLATLMEADAEEFVAEDGDGSERADYAEYIAGELAKMVRP